MSTDRRYYVVVRWKKTTYGFRPITAVLVGPGDDLGDVIVLKECKSWNGARRVAERLLAAEQA